MAVDAAIYRRYFGLIKTVFVFDNGYYFLRTSRRAYATTVAILKNRYVFQLLHLCFINVLSLPISIARSVLLKPMRYTASAVLSRDVAVVMSRCIQPSDIFM